MDSFLDPTLEVDVYGEKPWALSPTLATFNYLSLTAKKPEYTPSILEKSVERLGELYDGRKSRSSLIGDPASAGRVSPRARPSISEERIGIVY